MDSVVNNNNQTLFDKIGGLPKVESIVDTFYYLVLNTPEVAVYFEEINMKKQKMHQTNFISFVLGSGKNYTGNNLRDAHRHLNLTEKEFYIIANLLSEALLKNNIEKDDVEKIIALVATTKNDILNA